MEFENQTPFPALAFQGIDQHQQAFHVVALRQTLSWQSVGLLEFADEQEALCEEDVHLMPESSGAVVQESDLCHYKPRCDVIVKGLAYPPRGGTSRMTSFPVRLTLSKPPSAVVLPSRPQGLNPFMAPSPEALRDWQQACEAALARAPEGETLVSKSLIVHGPRAFVRASAPVRLVGAVLRVGSLGLLRWPRWRLVAGAVTEPVPLDLGQSWGGLIRIMPGTPAAKSLKRRFAGAGGSSKPASQALRVDACAANPAGKGFARSWFLRAERLSRIAAPRLESPSHPVTAQALERVLSGNKGDGSGLVAGMGVRPKGHPDRAKLAGTVDERFAASDEVLPQDFDFAVWNAAWPDQQTGHLAGDEHLELLNLCPADQPAAEPSEKGTRLRLALPGHQVALTVRMASGEIFYHRASLDTLIVDTQRQTVSLVWRAILAKDDEDPIRKVEARSYAAAQWQQLMRDTQAWRAWMDSAQAGEAAQEALHG